MSLLAWLAVAAAVWLAVAAAVGVWIGRVIRNRDRQTPTSLTDGRTDR